ncbi:MAG TPA: GNAT family protein [Tepidisphaeraceae bacterium]|jgi:RimJ/RimL family protein N-acetyltransferase|nr:GNAT family protein [Tepidisphaeraceae bacterium]
MTPPKNNGLLLDVPDRLTTERLELRVPEPGEGALANAAVVESIAEVGRWMPWARPTPTVEQTETWVRQSHAKYILRQEIPYYIFLRETEEFVGVITLFEINYAVPRAEIGYWQRTRHTGKGYMQEAVAAVVRVGFETLSMERLEIRCIAGNLRSARVAQRAGFRLDGTLRNYVRNNEGAACDYEVYGLLRREYKGV